MTQCDRSTVALCSSEGRWERNKPHGPGKLTYPSGDVFEGNFELGVRWGVGVTSCDPEPPPALHPHPRQHIHSPLSAVQELCCQLCAWFSAVCVGRYADGRLEVARFVAGENDRKEAAFWSSDRRTAYRIMRDGEECEEVRGLGLVRVGS